MKTFIKTITFLMCVTTFCLSSCQQEANEASDSNERAQVINQAKKWFEKQCPDRVVYIPIHDGTLLPATPNWSQAMRRKNQDFSAVEVALSWEKGVSFFSEDCKQLYEETGDERYLQSKTRIVVLTDRQTNETTSFLMTLIPDSYFLHKTDMMPFKKVTYLDKVDFTGRIILRTLDGEWIKGSSYYEGEEDGFFSIQTGGTNSIQTRALVCKETPIYHKLYFPPTDEEAEMGIRGTWEDVFVGYDVECYDDEDKDPVPPILPNITPCKNCKKSSTNDLGTKCPYCKEIK